MQIDVIIPVYNQKESLNLTLWGFKNQNTDIDTHIIIVDDGSTDKVSEVVSKYQDFLNVTFLSKSNSGRAKSRNFAINFLKSDFIIFNDADRIPGKDFIVNHAKNLIKNEKVICIGLLKEIYFSDIIANKEKIMDICHKDLRYARETQYSKIIDILFDESGSIESSVPWITTMSCNMSLHRSEIESIGGFDENFVSWGFEHFELGYRLHKNGCKFHRERKSVNYHLAHPRPNNFYENSIETSHKYFYKKHNHKDVNLLKPFMLGEISLQEYESLVNGTILWEKRNQKPIYNRIINGV